MIEFVVHGTPIPQGSMRAFNTPRGARATHSNAKILAPYRETLRLAAINAVVEQDPLMFDNARESSYRVEMEFYFARPPSLPKRCEHKNTKPDIDKLERAVLDALTNVCFDNDAKVVESSKKKAFDHNERIVVRVYKWHDGQWA